MFVTKNLVLLIGKNQYLNQQTSQDLPHFLADTETKTVNTGCLVITGGGGVQQKMTVKEPITFLYMGIPQNSF
jgi:hypothetical protein